MAICLTTGLLFPHSYSWAAQAVTDHNEVDPIEGISGIYSDMEMRMRLAAKPNAQECSGEACLSNQQFDARVLVIGEHLAKSAYEVYPELKKKVPNFVFSVADKQVLGSASNAGGTVVIFRGIQHLDLGDEALAFIVGREMGHVIANHHKSNAKTRLLISALAAVLFPAVGILSASSAATQATAASTSLLTSVASTATSIVGSEVAMSRIKPGQLTEADDVSISILTRTGLTTAEVAQSLEFIVENEIATGWETDLNQSIHYVRQLAGDSKEIVAELEPLPEAYVDKEHIMELPVESKSRIALADSPPKVDELVKQPQPLQKPLEEKSEDHRIILITNESLAQSHRQSNLSQGKPLKVATTKKNIYKKSKTSKIKSGRGIKEDASAAKKSKFGKNKKPVAIKPVNKAGNVKRKTLAKSN